MAEHGAAGDPAPSLVDLLDRDTIRRISRALPPEPSSLSAQARFLGGMNAGGLDWEQLRRLKPWMAFFQIWSAHLRRSGWRFSMELDVLKIAADLDKSVRTLETIAEQLQALDNVPLERFVRFLRQTDWRRSRRAHARSYLAGDLQGLLQIARDYPTRCEAIIARRDPVLYARMRPFLDQGSALVFVGTTHVPGIMALLQEDGFEVRQLGEAGAAARG